MNLETHRSKGFGFVKFEDPRDADDAIAEADGKVPPAFFPQALVLAPARAGMLPRLAPDFVHQQRC